VGLRVTTAIVTLVVSTVAPTLLNTSDKKLLEVTADEMEDEKAAAEVDEVDERDATTVKWTTHVYVARSPRRARREDVDVTVKSLRALSSTPIAAATSVFRLALSSVVGAALDVIWSETSTPTVSVVVGAKVGWVVVKPLPTPSHALAASVQHLVAASSMSVESAAHCSATVSVTVLPQVQEVYAPEQVPKSW
jgi:hypothetical protein